MSAAREGKNVWWYLFGFWSNGKWRGRDLFTRRFWRHKEYILQDSFLTHWNRAVGCRVSGHAPLVNVSDPGEPHRMFCFKCYREVKP
jgi:hypothetical protein